MTQNIVPFSLKDAPSLIEKVLPAQKLSLEVFKEREGRQSQTLTALGSYWKGRKPLVLNKACILGSLLPASQNLKEDLEVFELLMAMDDESFIVRWGHPDPDSIVGSVPMPNLYDYFVVDYPEELPGATPLNVEDFKLEDGSVPSFRWREDVAEEDVRRLELDYIARISYRDRMEKSKRAELVYTEVHSHIWKRVNSHLGTDAASFPELVQQLGLMRFGRTPRVADTFSGSGQIPFEAARLGCDVYASDLNPVACMLTWGALNIVGADEEKRQAVREAQQLVFSRAQAVIDDLGIEKDDKGATAKVFLYCVEATCPESGWTVPLLPSRIISKGHMAIVDLEPDASRKRYNVLVRRGVSVADFKAAGVGTVVDGAMVHSPSKGKTFRTKLATLRGDYQDASGGAPKNKLRAWGRGDFDFTAADIFRERLYAVQWQFVVQVNGREKTVTEFRSVTADDEVRELAVKDYVSSHLADWQRQGWVPSSQIEQGAETSRLLKERGWTHWHHLFNPRQLLVFGLYNQFGSADTKFALFQALNNNCRLSRWHPYSGVGQTVGVFDNQALNTLLNYGCRGWSFLGSFLLQEYRNYPIGGGQQLVQENRPAAAIEIENDIYVTDPPYGDAVAYEEILDFFISWVEKNPPEEFGKWVWDSRRALAVRGEDDDFRRAMVSAYKAMREHMPDNGIQVVMFTHQSGSIWADMANIIWASGLQVTAAWYVVTETDNALREGSYVKGTILLVLRKRGGNQRTYQSDLAWELEQEVNDQVATLTGLNQQTRSLYRDENLFSDADLQMAGYAAALRVLTKYSVIDGKDMASEAQRPRVKGQKTLVDELIEFAVGVANQALVPGGIEKPHWDRLQPAERFYLKMLDLESFGAKTLDNYQNFSKAFKVKDFRPLMASEKANSARLKSAAELGRAEMNESSELYNTPLRGILYGVMELGKDRDGDEVVAHLAHNIPDFYNHQEVVTELADYLSKKLEALRPDEASNARVLRDLVRNQRL
ncbi:anti-phage-associated DUF1156 domain-containing protein [Variovorax sp. J31P207]|uniref:anti-phage-associated DUF1156 domain-containing protein n=1 Tax=Variovorax sp. J31P207 TaxID=3053510 RepID=UPI0025771579|nr:anti-phage-associated DUF1156 domain-containing protein [Variovorax sp. J31P207]MDM0068788.1 DUF1156 domain-containing protein [Variovorax sp. J31P207]